MNLLASRPIFLAAFCATALVAQASDVASAKTGMRERVAVIDKLKAAGSVGEANTGLLAVRAPGEEAEKVVAAENADRTVVFGELAKKTGGSAEDAGRTFARQLAAASKPGVWVQREDGGWYKK
jgi:uncharacterized protein YdbL (DUF1318 family)